MEEKTIDKANMKIKYIIENRKGGKKEKGRGEICGEISLLMAKKHWKRCLVASVTRKM